MNEIELQDSAHAFFKSQKTLEKKYLSEPDELHRLLHLMAKNSHLIGNTVDDALIDCFALLEQNAPLETYVKKSQNDIFSFSLSGDFNQDLPYYMRKTDKKHYDYFNLYKKSDLNGTLTAEQAEIFNNNKELSNDELAGLFGALNLDNLGDEFIKIAQ